MEGNKTTSTYIKVDSGVLECFKEVIKKEGYRLQKGFENSLKEYTDKRNSKKNKGIVG